MEGKVQIQEKEGEVDDGNCQDLEVRKQADQQTECRVAAMRSNNNAPGNTISAYAQYFDSFKV